MRITGTEISVNRDALNACSGQIIASGMRVHSRLGPGLLESAYRACLAHELRKMGFHVDEELGLPVFYDEVKLDVG